jgi:phosphate transport system substrate-binding protein
MTTMMRVRNTLAVLAFTTLLGCSVESPASTPITQHVNFTLYATYATQPLTRNLTEQYTDIRPEFNITVTDNSYGNLITQVTAGRVDYFMSTYVPSDDNIWAAPIARDGLVLIAHPDNSITNLKIDDIRGIFSGRLKQWQSLDGDNEAIIPLTFQTNDDVYHEFHRLVMGRQRITSNAQVVPNIAAMIRQISTTPNTIGYVPLSYVTDAVKILSIDDIFPNQSTMIDNIYPLRITLFVIGREEPPSEYRTFFSWIQSRDGQTIVSQNYTALP